MEDLVILITKICVFVIIIYIPILILKWLCGAFPRLFGFLKGTRSDGVKKFVAGIIFACGVVLTIIINNDKERIDYTDILIMAPFAVACFLYLSKDEEDFWNWLKHPIRSLQNYIYMRERVAGWRREYQKKVESSNGRLEIQELIKSIVTNTNCLDEVLTDIHDYASNNSSKFSVTEINKYNWGNSFSLDDEQNYSSHFKQGVAGVKVSAKAYEGLDEYVVEYGSFLGKIKEYFSSNTDKVLQEFKFEPCFCAIYVGILGMKADDKAHEEEMRKVNYYEAKQKEKEEEGQRKQSLNEKKRRRFDLSDL